MAIKRHSHNGSQRAGNMVLRYQSNCGCNRHRPDSTDDDTNRLYRSGNGGKDETGQTGLCLVDEKIYECGSVPVRAVRQSDDVFEQEARARTEELLSKRLMGMEKTMAADV